MIVRYLDSVDLWVRSQRPREDLDSSKMGGGMLELFPWVEKLICLATE